MTEVWTTDPQKAERELRKWVHHATGSLGEGDIELLWAAREGTAWKLIDAYVASRAEDNARAGEAK